MHGRRSRTVEHKAFTAEDGISPSRFLSMSASSDEMIYLAELRKNCKKSGFQVNRGLASSLPLTKTK